MSRNNKTNKNASFNSMRIVKGLFSDSLFLLHKSEIKKDCFEYCFTSLKENKKLYYWVNWTGETVKIDIKLKGKKSEYYAENLFDKNLDNKEFSYNILEIVDSKISLKPYSVSSFEIIK